MTNNRWKTIHAIFPILALAINTIRAEEPALFEPAPVERILDKDVNGWIAHLKEFENEKQRGLAMLCLAEFGPAASGAVDELIKLSKSESQPETERRACITLGAIGPPAIAAMPDLLAILNNPSAAASHRAAACGAAARIDPESPSVQRAIIAALHDRAREVRWEAIGAAAWLAPRDTVVLSTLSRMLYAPEDAHEIAIALRLAGDEGIGALIHGLECRDAAVRAECAGAIGHAGKSAAQALPIVVSAAGRERDPAASLLLTYAAARIGPADPLLDVLAQRLSLNEKDVLPEELARSDQFNFPRTPYEYETKLILAAGVRAVPALGRGLRSRDSVGRIRIVNILAKLAPPPAEAVSDLIARVQDSDDAVRLAAAKALDAYGPVAALAKDALEQMSRSEPEGAPAQRAAALAALNVSRSADRPRYKWAIEPDTDEQVLGTLRDPKAWLRQEAAEALRVRADPNGLIAAALQESLNDSDPRVQIAAARSLAHFGKYTAAATNTFLKWLESDDFALRRAALVAMAGMGEEAKVALPGVIKAALAPAADNDKELQAMLSAILRIIGPDAVTALTAQLKNEDAAQRSRAAHALESMGGVAATAIPEFIELCKSAVDSDAQAGFACLGAMGPTAYPLAASYLAGVLHGDLFADRRKWATWALEKIKVPAAGDKEKVIDALLLALLDPDPAVCRGAHGALVRIGDAALPRLRTMLTLGEGDAPYWALRVLARMKADPSSVIPKLTDYAQPGKLPVERGVSAELLGNYAPGHTEIIPALLRVLGDQEDFVARAAIRSLVPFGESAIPSLNKLLKHRNPLMRKRALEAIDAIHNSTDGALH